MSRIVRSPSTGTSVFGSVSVYGASRLPGPRREHHPDHSAASSSSSYTGACCARPYVSQLWIVSAANTTASRPAAMWKPGRQRAGGAEREAGEQRGRPSRRRRG